ncbi:MAG: DUF1501 domain-containing protein [Pirellulales bacterium]
MKPTRREFLKATVGSSAIISLGRAAPSFLLHAAEIARLSGGETVLVVVQLTGGNDGLNTVVPFRDEAYRQARPKLAIPQSDVLKVDADCGFHPSMRGFADLLETGKLAVVHGVGYPNPNRSHFESMDIWHTCYHQTNRRSDGWLGRYLDATHEQAGSDVPALHLGGEQQPLALAAGNVRVPSIHSLEGFRLRGGENGDLPSTIKQLAEAKRASTNHLLDFVQTSTSAALTASQRVEEATLDYKSDTVYPTTGLASKLRTVAQLIDAGLSTQIYYVELDGFDTHSRQAAAHSALLSEFSDAVSAFISDIAQHGHGQRVLVMSFSEFGRRVKENASEGTDHGAAAPMFVAGGRVQAGLVGRQPSLTELDDGDVKSHTDFRQVYATVLEDWLAWQSAPILGDQYEKLPLFVA